MPAWLAAALALLRSAGIGAAVTGGALVAQDVLTDESPRGFGTGLAFPLGVGGTKRRRRRRRALTASDRADIGFITGLLGPTAGKNFAITIATRGT